VGAVYRSGTRFFVAALPFLIMGAVTLADALTGPATGLIPLLSLGPAFAAVFQGLRNTVLIGVAALALCALDAASEGGISFREETLAITTVAGVTVAAVIAGVARERRERELADVRTIAEIAQQVVLRPMPAGEGPVRFAVRYLSAAARAQIGGDLYEVTPGADGTRLIVGDVQGKGLTAVQTAAFVLGAFRAAAEEDSFRFSLADDPFVAEGMRERRLAAEHRPEPPLVIQREAVDKVAVHHRSVKRSHAAHDGDGLMECGQIAESDHRPGIAAESVVIDAIENAHRAVAAAGEEEGIELVGVQVMVELRGALVVAAGEISAEAMIDVRSERDARAARRLEPPPGGFDPLELGGRGDGQDREVRIGGKCPGDS